MRLPPSDNFNTGAGVYCRSCAYTMTLCRLLLRVSQATLLSQYGRRCYDCGVKVQYVTTANSLLWTFIRLGRSQRSGSGSEPLSVKFLQSPVTRLAIPLLISLRSVSVIPFVSHTERRNRSIWESRRGHRVGLMDTVIYIAAFEQENCPQNQQKMHVLFFSREKEESINYCCLSD